VKAAAVSTAEEIAAAASEEAAQVKKAKAEAKAQAKAQAKAKVKAAAVAAEPAAEPVPLMTREELKAYMGRIALVGMSAISTRAAVDQNSDSECCDSESCDLLPQNGDSDSDSPLQPQMNGHVLHVMHVFHLIMAGIKNAVNATKASMEVDARPARTVLSFLFGEFVVDMAFNLVITPACVLRVL
jgi:hypothetical protein